MNKDQFMAALSKGRTHFCYQPNCDHTITTAGSVFEHHYQVRVVGNLKLWKTRPEKFEIPVRAGSWNTTYITEGNVKDYALPEECEDLVAAAAYRKERDRTHVSMSHVCDPNSYCRH